MIRAIVPAVITLVLAACVADTADGPVVVPESEPVECGPDTPSITWETFGEGFVTTHCQSCHASTALDRHGAPEDVVFDTKEETEAFGPLILAAATPSGEKAPRMPPAGGPDDTDRELLSIWLTCFSE